MFQFVDNGYTAILEGQREKRLELEKAKRTNEELKLRLNHLEEENSHLRNKFANNEEDIITKKNDLNNLLEIFQKERRACLEESQRLEICKEQIDSMTTFIEELKPIKELLGFKQNVEECLQDLLIKTKLQIAESEHTLQGLHDYLTQLEYDVEKTKNVHKQGLGHWQDEYLAARLREADIILEFDKLKRELATIKHDLEEKVLIREARETIHGKLSGIRLHNDPIVEAILAEEEDSINNTVEYQNEIDFLRHQLRKLEDQKQDCKTKIRSNEEMKLHINEVRRSIWLREFETNQKTEKLKKSYQKLAEKMSHDLGKIQNSIEEKDFAIARIEVKIKELNSLNETLEEDLRISAQEDPADELEIEKFNLETEIQRLKKT